MSDTGGLNIQPSALAIDHLREVLDCIQITGGVCAETLGVAAAAVAHWAGRMDCEWHDDCQHGDDLIRATFDGPGATA